jgi:hypothetical protein
MTACPSCRTEELPEMGIVVGTARGGAEKCCTVCLARELRTETILTDREAEVAAHEQLTDADAETISERTGIPRGAVVEASRQIDLKLEQLDRLRNSAGGA